VSDVVAPAPSAPAAPAPAESAPSTAPAREGLSIPETVTKANIAPSKRARALAMLNGAGGAEAATAPEPAAPPAATDAPTDAPEPATEPEKPAKGKADAAPEPAREEPPKIDTRLAKALADLAARDKAILAAKQAEKEHAAKLAAYEAQLEAIRKDPLAALKAAGTDFDALTKKVLAGELKPPTADETLRATVDEKTATLEAKLKALEEERAAEKAAAAEREQAEMARANRDNDLRVVKQTIDAASEKFPLVAALPGAHENVLRMAYEAQTSGETGWDNIFAHAEKLEAALAEQVTAIVANPKALVRLAKANPKIRETILGALGGAPQSQSRQNPASREGPRVLPSDVVSAATTPIDRPKTKEERRKHALALMKQAFNGGGS
jgi:hypothetical protein